MILAARGSCTMSESSNAMIHGIPEHHIYQLLVPINLVVDWVQCIFPLTAHNTLHSTISQSLHQENPIIDRIHFHLYTITQMTNVPENCSFCSSYLNNTLLLISFVQYSSSELALKGGRGVQKRITRGALVGLKLTLATNPWEHQPRSLVAL